MTEKKRPQEEVTSSLPQPVARPDGSFTLEPDAEAFANKLSLLKEQEPREFVVTAAHSQSGRELAPFIVRAKDEAAARKLSQRNYLVIRSVERYAEQEGREKPRVLPYGPPISDKDFERDYGNRPPDHPTHPKSSNVLVILGWLFCGPVGAVLGWVVGKSLDEPQRRGD
jgi:hypothetical protein